MQRLGAKLITNVPVSPACGPYHAYIVCWTRNIPGEKTVMKIEQNLIVTIQQHLHTLAVFTEIS